MDKATTQADMNACAAKSYRVADAELNQLYAEVEKRLANDPDGKKKFIAAQRAWIAFRDSECAFVTFRDSGGTIGPMAFALCREDLTSRRIHDFKQYLTCKEGDASCPTHTSQ